MPDNTKICPLLGAGPIEIDSTCKGDRCAWWNVDRCAVIDIAQHIEELGNISSALLDYNPQS